MGSTQDKMKADLELRRYSKSTQDNYLRYAKKFVAYFMRPAEQMGETEIRTFLLYQLREKKISDAGHKMYVAAIKFLYNHTIERPEEVVKIPWPKVPRKLPDILSGSEVLTLLDAIPFIKTRAIVTTAYGTGMRVSEACNLLIADIDSKRMLIHIREGKRNRDRYVMLGKQLLLCLRHYFKTEHPKGPCLFPGQQTDQPICSKSVQEAVRKAAKACGINKRVTPHSMRHAFATHLLETGADIRTIQVLLGHGSIRTTTIYTQVSKKHVARVTSPLDLVGTPQGQVLG
ncbi:MAG: integrase [Gammaproteobacteria bacterium]|nr:MAG: integrase [Gammaproteobacteria bacterium]